MLTLDDEEILIERPVGMDDPPPRRSINLRPLLIGLAVVLAGGAVGTAGYFLSNINTRTVIGMLDVADSPRLAMDMPGRAKAKPDEPPPPPEDTKPGERGKSGGLVAPGFESAGVAPMPQAPPIKLEPMAPIKLDPLPAIAEILDGAVTMPAPPAETPAAAPAATAPAAPVAVPTPAVPTPAAGPPAPTLAALPTQPVPRNVAQPPSYAALPARAGEVKPLPPVPVEGLLQQSAAGALPVVGRNGQQPWQAYARPFDDVHDRPRLAVVVVGLGLDKEATEAAIAKLPPEVTLVFSPYAGGLDKWIKKARDLGHEVLLELPAEGSGFPARDPGPLGLLSTAAHEDNIAHLERVLARAIGYTGVWAADGPFTRSAQLRPVLMALKDRGLLYVGSGAKDEPRPPTLAPSAIIDSEPFRDAIDARLAQIAAEAPQKGKMVVIASARPVTLDRLITFFAKLADQNVALAPASAVMRQGGKS